MTKVQKNVSFLFLCLRFERKELFVKFWFEIKGVEIDDTLSPRLRKDKTSRKPKPKDFLFRSFWITLSVKNADSFQVTVLILCIKT